MAQQRIDAKRAEVSAIPQDSFAGRGPIFMVDSVGAQRGMHYYNFPYVDALNRAGLDVRLLSTSETVEHPLLPAGIRTAPAFRGIYGSLPKPLRAGNYLASLARIARMARAYSASIAHFHFYQVPPADELLTRWLNRSGVATLATIHDIVPFADGEDVSRGRGSTLHHLYRQLSGIIVNSQFALTALKELDPDLASKAVVVPHGNFSAYAHANAVPQAEARARLDLSQHVPILLVFGTVKPNKRLDLVLQALPEIVRLHPDVRLVVAGKPRETSVDDFTALAGALGISANVDWRLRFIDDAEAPLYFCAADALLFPYQWIYQSGALLMAMSFGRPVVATDVGSNPEFVQHGVTGLLVPLGSSGALAEAVTALLDQDGYAARLGESAAQYVETELSWDKLARMTKDFYAQVLARSGDAQ